MSQSHSFAPRFEKLTPLYLSTVFNWLDEPHMQEYWDNSQEHRTDLANFVNGRSTPSHYFNGIFSYWIGFIAEEAYCLILTAPVIEDDSIQEVWKDNLSTTGTTYSLDFGIGNKKYLSRKLAAPTLKHFTHFFRNSVDKSADTFFIDPAQDNPRAIHVYEQAGFKKVADFFSEAGVFKGVATDLMVMTLPKQGQL